MKKATGSVVGLAAAVVIAAIVACGHDDNEAINPPPVEAGPPAEAGPPDAPTGNGLCVNGKPSAEYPPGATAIQITKTIPNLAFAGTDADATTPHDVKLSQFYEPCAPKSRLLVLRVGAGWCGTCDWHWRHTKLLTGTDLASRFVVVDVLVADEDNAPPDLALLPRIRGKSEAISDRYAIDPANVLRAIDVPPVQLPLYVLVDTRTMVIRNFMSDPSPEVFDNTARDELALLDGTTRPQKKDDARNDGVFNREQWDMLNEMTLPGAPPPDPTNEFADSALAAALGQALFSDKSLSPSGNVACSTCHDRDKLFTDGLPQAEGVAKVDRNSPTLALAAHQRWQFWDGRADTLWMQALGPPEDAKEIGSSRLFIAHKIFDKYKAQYEAAFPKYAPMPNLADTVRFPPAGKPGTAAYDAMAAADQDAVTRVYVNVGKAIAAFERTLRVKPNALDRYIGGDRAALSNSEKLAAQTFFVAGCAQCHWGPRMTDDAFHVVRFPTGRQDGAADRGRVDAIAKLKNAEFNSKSKWSDKPSEGDRLAKLYDGPNSLGAFKTPPLRGVDRSEPFGHGGTLATLEKVVENYGKPGLDPGDNRAVGTMETWLPKFDSSVQSQLPLFLHALGGEIGP